MPTDPDESYRRDGRKRSSKGDLKKLGKGLHLDGHDREGRKAKVQQHTTYKRSYIQKR